MRTPADILRELKQQMARRVALLISDVVINLVDAAGAVQMLQVSGLADETLDEVEHRQDYGFVSHPPKGSQGIMAGISGVRSNGIVFAVGNRKFRLKGLARGEVAIHDDQGQVVHLKRAGILIKSAQKVEIEGSDVTVKGSEVTIEGDAKVTGNALVEGDATVNGNVKLGENATKFVMLADMTPSSKVLAE